MFTVDEARELLDRAKIFHEVDEEEDTPGTREINLNDTLGWACSDCEEVKDEEMPGLAALFYRYGFCGILYWVVERRGGRTDFADNNRFIEFVRNEQLIVKENPDSNKRGCLNVSYTIGKEQA